MLTLHSIAKRYRSSKYGIVPEIIYRWSPRAMNGKPVTKSEMFPLLEAAKWAPSSNNNQEWHFYIAKRSTQSFQTLFSFLSEGNKPWCENAGAFVVIVSKKISDHKNHPLKTHSFDAGAAWMAFAIEGIKRNLVVHAMAGFDYKKTSKFLSINSKKFGVECLVAVGKPSENCKNERVSNRLSTSSFLTALP